MIGCFLTKTGGDSLIVLLLKVKDCTKEKTHLQGC
jgi:hypothetical protein